MANNGHKPTTLAQIVAIEKGVKSRCYGETTELHKIEQKPDLFTGFVKHYRKKSDDGDDYPSEQKHVQQRADEILKRVSELLTEVFDVTATKDYANCAASADVIVDGKLLIAKAPAPFLLFIEKQLTDIHSIVDKLPILDGTEEWNRDENSGLFKTKAQATQKMKKVNVPLVLYHATENHPAQTQLVTEDVVVGYWDTVKHSGGIPAPRRKELLERVEKLTKAVKQAREQANTGEAPPVQVGRALFEYLLA